MKHQLKDELSGDTMRDCGKFITTVISVNEPKLNLQETYAVILVKVLEALTVALVAQKHHGRSQVLSVLNRLLAKYGLKLSLTDIKKGR